MASLVFLLGIMISRLASAAPVSAVSAAKCFVRESSHPARILSRPLELADSSGKITRQIEIYNGDKTRLKNLVSVMFQEKQAIARVEAIEGDPADPTLTLRVAGGQVLRGRLSELKKYSMIRALSDQTLSILRGSEKPLDRFFPEKNAAPQRKVAALPDDLLHSLSFVPLEELPREPKSIKAALSNGFKQFSACLRHSCSTQIFEESCRQILHGLAGELRYVIQDRAKEAKLTPEEMLGACGLGRDYFCNYGFKLQERLQKEMKGISRVLGSGNSIEAIPHQSDRINVQGLFGQKTESAQHAFSVMQFCKTGLCKPYLVDATFAQFFAQNQPSTNSAVGKWIRTQQKRDATNYAWADDLLAKGYVELTPKVAFEYLLALQAKSKGISRLLRREPVSPRSIISYQSGLLTELAELPSSRHQQAMNLLMQPSIKPDPRYAPNFQTKNLAIDLSLPELQEIRRELGLTGIYEQ